MNIRKSAAAVLAIALLVSCNGKKSAPNVDYNVPSPQDVVMYQINPRNFASAPAAKGEPSVFMQIVPELDAIKDLGTNVVWIMPIYPIGEVKSKNSPYSIADYKAVNPEFGSVEDFKHLVFETHRRDMAFILDWVANHTAWDNVWMKKHEDWYTQDSTGTIIYPEGTDWTDVADLDYDNKEMRKAMIDAMLFWVNEIGVDGFRCDVADEVPADFWKEAIDAVRASAKRPVLMLAEGNNPATFEGGFDMNYAWDYMNALRQVFCEDSSAVKLVEADMKEYEKLPEGKVKLRFTTNHDEATKKSTVEEFGGVEGALAAYVSAVFTNGAALIYGEQEVAYPKVINFFQYNRVDWNANPDVRDRYKDIIRVFKTCEGIHGPELKSFTKEDVLMLEKAGKYLVVVNVRPEVSTVDVPEEWRTIKCTNLLDGETEVTPDVFNLEPYEYRILGK